jgi:hypothetical protein
VCAVFVAFLTVFVDIVWYCNRMVELVEGKNITLSSFDKNDIVTLRRYKP